MILTEVTDESKCCCSCRHNKRTKKDEADGMFEVTLCHCEKDGHYIGYIQNFEQTCEEWEKDEAEEEMSDTNMTIKCRTEGFEEATQDIETLAEAYDGFPAQVTIKNCHDCIINIYPSQTKFVEKVEDET